MTVKNIPWWKPQVGSVAERNYINKALDDNYINEGKLVEEFEKNIAKLVKAKYAIATTSCTAGIFLALKAMGIGYGDEVIVPDITFIATANAVDLTGAKPILVDVFPDTLNINTDAIKKAITPKTKAIVPVHVTGRGANMEEISKIAREHKLHVVEDAAEALMSKQKNKYLGTFGNAGCFSFSPNKTITTGQGGMIVTNDENICNRLKMLKDQGRPTRGTGGDDRHDIIGYNFKMTDLQAAVGLGQLNFLQTRIERMRRNHQLYQENLKDVKEIFIYKTNLAEAELPQWTDVRLEKRDELAQFLKEKNIDTRKYWFPLHQQLAYKLSDDNFPNSVKVSPRSLWLPSAFTLKDADIKRVCENIKSFFQT